MHDDERRGCLGFISDALNGLLILPEKILSFMIKPMAWVTAIGGFGIIGYEFNRVVKSLDKTAPVVEDANKYKQPNNNPSVSEKPIYKEVPTSSIYTENQAAESEWIRRNIDMKDRTLKPQPISENTVPQR